MSRRIMRRSTWLAALAVAPGMPAWAQGSLCAEAVQGRIAWNYEGDRSWQEVQSVGDETPPPCTYEVPEGFSKNEWTPDD